MRIKFPIVFLLMIYSSVAKSQNPTYHQTVSGTTTIVSISDLEHLAPIDSMIYGQMLEDCNDAVIYDGVVDKKGRENLSVTKQLKKLNIPVMRWPAGTAIYDYEWEKGVGPTRTAENEYIWGGKEYYTFGTDEFVNWCAKLDIEPYINIPMGNNNTYDHSVEKALCWVEYVNGNAGTPMGAYRVSNGHAEPYNVRYFCIGNENYLANKFHKAESATEYADQLSLYASAIKKMYPEVKLLGVGHTGKWNKTVAEKCGKYLDFLTMHYYMTANVRDKALMEPQRTLFAPELVEANLRYFINDMTTYNISAGRTSNPIRFSIDEWNCRHSVYNGSGYSFTRKDSRRLYDAAAMAGMLNVFIRTSPYVAMANYIFPVNGHGLMKTVGNQDAYPSVCYYLYSLYRRFMTGHAVGVDVTGPGIKNLELSSLKIDGDTDSSQKGKKLDRCYIDCAAVLNEEKSLVVSLVNRSYDTKQEISVLVPEGYKLSSAYMVSANDVCAENTEDNRLLVKSTTLKLTSPTVTLNPCATILIQFDKDTSEGMISQTLPLFPYVVNGRIYVEGEDDFNVYTTSGYKVNEKAKQSPGIYVVQVGERSKKVSVEY